MMTTTRAIALWVLVIFVGIQFGAGWYEKLGVIPMWADVPPEQALTAMEQSGFRRAGRAFWPFVSPVVALLSLINLYLAWRTPVPFRRWWLAAAAIMACYSASTYGYFATRMLLFQSHGADWSPARVDSFIDTWTTLNYPRMILGAIGWVCALRALSLSGNPTRAAAVESGGGRTRHPEF
ncbi:DUF1772 domain-containing protein [Nocardia transvalensis]|uniref:DUF1772 domain-containing protein n=1 Tax=Nocardia transvalensis TaxID=37333 RepID=UPI00189428DC|nr:DUF1772 domain-containing protein [Nocardia transvalensis]MBF6328334.1 DUF1772 domain-containing protein [Nocardia transvalensis]